MADWVKVNNCKMDRHFLEGNIAEARKYVWEPVRWERDNSGHAHCMICLNTIPEERAPVADGLYYRSGAGWLCIFCFQSFLRQAMVKRVF